MSRAAASSRTSSSVSCSRRTVTPPYRSASALRPVCKRSSPSARSVSTHSTRSHTIRLIANSTARKNYLIHPVTIFNCDYYSRARFECIDSFEQQVPALRLSPPCNPAWSRLPREAADRSPRVLGLTPSLLRSRALRTRHRARLADVEKRGLSHPGRPWTIANPARPFCADSYRRRRALSSCSRPTNRVGSDPLARWSLTGFARAVDLCAQRGRLPRRLAHRRRCGR